MEIGLADTQTHIQAKISKFRFLFPAHMFVSFIQIIQNYKKIVYYRFIICINKSVEGVRQTIGYFAPILLFLSVSYKTMTYDDPSSFQLWYLFRHHIKTAEWIFSKPHIHIPTPK